MPCDAMVTWLIFCERDARPYLEKVNSCLADFRRRLRRNPTMVGVISDFPELAEKVLEERGVRVIRNLPAWAESEIWVGAEDE